MKICVFGAGAIGGYLGAQLTESGADVTLIARGPHLEAMREKGLTLRITGETRVVDVKATDDPRKAGPQDAVFLTLKAPGVAAIAEHIQPLLGPDTAVVTAMNGVLWWYFFKHGGPHDGHRLSSVDPGGTLWQAIDPARCIGCVVYPAAELVEPGVIHHQYGNRFSLGEPDGSRSERVEALADLLSESGLRAPVRTKIRDDIWVKLWGNLSFNPISALTHATMVQIATDAGTRSVVTAMMAEAQAVGEALGIKFAVDIETRIGWAADVGEHKTSMLQDLELGRTMEIDSLVGAVAEMGDLVGVDTPLIDSVLALVVQRARNAGCYPK